MVPTGSAGSGVLPVSFVWDNTPPSLGDLQFSAASQSYLFNSDPTNVNDHNPLLPTDSAHPQWVSATSGNLSFAISDNPGGSGLTSGSISIDGTVVYTNNVVASDGTILMNYSFPSIALGKHTFTITATDSVSNQTTKTFYLGFDTAIPTLSATGQTANASNHAIVLTVTPQDNHSYDSGIDPSGFTYSQVRNGHLDFSDVPVSNNQVNLNASGNYSLTFKVKDLAANTAIPLTVNQTVLVNPPKITPSVPSSSTIWYSLNGSSSLTAQALDDALEVLPVYASTDQQAWTLLSDGQIPLHEGVNQLSLKATDAASSTTILPVTFKIDSVSPAASMSYSYGGQVTALSPAQTNYLHSGYSLSDTSTDPIPGSGIASSVYSVDGSQINNPTSTMALLTGKHSYKVTVIDTAGNTAAQTYDVVYNDTPVSLLSSNISYQDLSQGGTSTTLNTQKALNATSFRVGFPGVVAGGQTTWGGSFAAPTQMTVWFDANNAGSSVYSFTADAQGTYSTLIPLSGLTDGPHVIHYSSLMDMSGLGSSNGGAVAFIVDRTGPSALMSTQVNRYSSRTGTSGNAIWSSDADGHSVIASSDVALVTSVSGSDGVQLSYTDASNTANFDQSGYSVLVQDSAVPSTQTTPVVTSVNGLYQFIWGVETSRTLTLTVVDEAGQSSPASTVVLVKPVWGGFSNPTKVSSNGSFSIVWNSDGTNVTGKEILWNSSNQSGGTPTYNKTASPNSGSVALSGVTQGLQVGDIIQWRAAVDMDSVLVLGTPGPDLAIGYEPLPALGNLPGLSFVGASGVIPATGLATKASDGSTLQYALEIAVDGSSNAPVYVPYEVTDPVNNLGRFSYDLAQLFGLSDAASLSQHLAGHSLDLRLAAWYGAPIGGTSGGQVVTNPSEGQSAGSPAVTYGAMTLAPVDQEGPKVTLTGVLADPGHFASSLTASGSLTDAGGSHLAKVVVTVTPNGAASYSLTQNFFGTNDAETFSIALTKADGSPLGEGNYTIQVQVFDGAGNINGLLTTTKFVDTNAPTKVSAVLSSSNGTDAVTGAVYSNADSTISLSLVSDDHSGSGLAAIAYEWTDTINQVVGNGWQTISVRPTPSFTAPVATETHSFGALQVPSGTNRLHLKLIDLAGNSSADLTDPAWLVSFNPNPPSVTNVVLAGLHNSNGSFFLQKTADLSASYSSTDAVSAANVEWAIASLDASGNVSSQSSWSGFGGSLDSVKSWISQDGQRYKVLLQARNANGQVTRIVSNSFVKDSTGPQNVGANVSGTSFIAGSPIGVNVTGTDSFSALVWTWSYTKPDGTVVQNDYTPGNDVTITAAGTFNLVFTATSGSGISVSTTPVAVSILGSGLAVRDFAKFNDGNSVIGGSWSYVGGTVQTYQYRWKTASGTILADWTSGDASQSAAIDLAPFGLTDGARVLLEVRALDAVGGLMADTTSAGSLVDASAPVFSAASWNAPVYVAPSDVWVQFQGDDAQSGLQNASVLIKKLVNADQVSSWQPVFEENINHDGNLRRLDLDLSGTSGLVTGDRIVIEVTLTNAAGLSTSKASSIVIVDASAPPAPIVMDMAEAVRQSQPVNFSWTFTAADPESTTVNYSWKAYTDSNDIADPNGWVDATAGTMSVDNFDASGYADGTILHFAVRATNGAGLVSIGTSRGVMMDSTAPFVSSLVALSSGLPIGNYLQVPGSGIVKVAGQFNASDYQSGLQNFTIQAGTWTPSTGFVPVGSTAEFSADPTLGQTSPLMALGSSSPAPGTIWQLRGQAVDLAGNVTSVISSGFKVVGDLPTLKNLAGVMSPDLVSFTWGVNNDSDLVKNYSVTVVGSKKTITTSVTSKTWSGAWADFAGKGESISFTVKLVTQVGDSNTLTTSLTVAPDAPGLTGFNYSQFFSNHMNVKTLAYAGDVGEIQWRLSDAQTGSVLQDWTGNYAGSQISIQNAFSTLSKAPADTARVLIEVKAKSSMGIWSPATPSHVIRIDQSPAGGLNLTRPTPYSNAPSGQIDGWNVGAVDGESGILAYQTLLVRAQDVPSDLTKLVWDGATTVSDAKNPGETLADSGVKIGSVVADGSYYAFLRVQNGTEDWSAAVKSASISVDRIPAVVSFQYAPSVFVTDKQGLPLAVKVTNNASETIALVSNKPGTIYSVSINAVQLAGQSGSSFVASDPGKTDAISVTATDLWGNQTTIADSLRFNEAPSVTILRRTTTSAQVLNLEQLVDVSDASSDYPLTYSWTLGGGNGIGYTDGTPYNGGPTSLWNSANYHQASFSQIGHNAVSHYSVSLTVTDSWGQTTVVPIDIEVDPTTSGVLFADEYWTGAVTLTGIVEVPAGIKLTLDAAQVTSQASLGGENIMNAGIQVDSGGNLLVNNTSGTSKLSSGSPGFLWRGISIAGNLQGSGLEIDDAERALTLLGTGQIDLTNIVLSRNLIGAHLLGGSLKLDTGRLSDNGEYAVKEDGIGSFVVKNLQFLNNAVDYYQTGKTQITIDELNGLDDASHPGNGGNQ